MSELPKSLTTAQRAIKAVKEAEKEGLAVREVVVDGRSFRLILAGESDRDEYDLRSMSL